MWTKSSLLNTTAAGSVPGAFDLSRRQMLRRMCAGFGLVGLAGMVGPQALLASSNGRAPHFAPRARRVIFLFLNGGPSHVDTFDPKPALAQYEGQQPTGDLYKKPKGTGFMPSPFRVSRCGEGALDHAQTGDGVGRLRLFAGLLPFEGRRAEFSAGSDR
jgi:hypothetical protein